MMTAMVALMRNLPVAVGFGAGTEARRPLRLAIVGALVVSQLPKLCVTPVVYSYIDKFQERVMGLSRSVQIQRKTASVLSGEIK